MSLISGDLLEAEQSTSMAMKRSMADLERKISNLNDDNSALSKQMTAMKAEYDGKLAGAQKNVAELEKARAAALAKANEMAAQLGSTKEQVTGVNDGEVNIVLARTCRQACWHLVPAPEDSFP